MAQVSGSTRIESAQRTGANDGGCRDGGVGHGLVSLVGTPSGGLPGDKIRHLRCRPAPHRGGGEATAAQPLGFEQAQDARPLHDLLARARVELGEQVLHVPLDRLFAHLHGQADLLVGEVARQQFQHLALLGRERHAGGGAQPRWRRRAGCGARSGAASGPDERRRRRAGASDLAHPVAQRRVGVVEDAQQAVGRGQVGRLAQQRAATSRRSGRAPRRAGRAARCAGGPA